MSLRGAAKGVLGLAALLLVAAAGTWWWARPDRPDAFYRPPDSIPSRPGALLRSEAFGRAVPSGARAWRILYTTTRQDGVPAVASAIVLAPANGPAGPRPVIAWAHGTTGAAAGCAPSLFPDPFAGVPALREVLAQGWVYVATDYAGLGTTGPHAYLIGEGEARSTLDAVRAARQLAELTLDDRTVVWGHSQGGHAALWTGMLAPGYASDVTIAGVVAIAPATDLPSLLEAAQDLAVGKVMSSYMVRAYAETYPDVQFDQVVRRGARLLTRDMSSRCLGSRKALFSVVEARVLRASIFTPVPAAGAFRDRLTENIPQGRIESPVLIAQGGADALVLAQIQQQFVLQRCSAGQRLEYWTFAGEDHLSIVAPDSPLNRGLIAWTGERLAGTPQAPGCGALAYE